MRRWGSPRHTASCISGLGSAIGLTRLVRAFVFAVSTLDPLVLGPASIVVATLAILACWLPARRAARIDPVRALRTE